MEPQRQNGHLARGIGSQSIRAGWPGPAPYKDLCGGASAPTILGMAGSMAGRQVLRPHSTDKRRRLKSILQAHPGSSGKSRWAASLRQIPLVRGSERSELRFPGNQGLVDGIHPLQPHARPDTLLLLVWHVLTESRWFSAPHT